MHHCTNHAVPGTDIHLPHILVWIPATGTVPSSLSSQVVSVQSVISACARPSPVTLPDQQYGLSNCFTRFGMSIDSTLSICFSMSLLSLGNAYRATHTTRIRSQLNTAARFCANQAQRQCYEYWLQRQDVSITCSHTMRALDTVDKTTNGSFTKAVPNQTQKPDKTSQVNKMSMQLHNTFEHV